MEVSLVATLELLWDALNFIGKIHMYTVYIYFVGCSTRLCTEFHRTCSVKSVRCQRRRGGSLWGAGSVELQ